MENWEAQYFVFDWCASFVEGKNAFAVLQVKNSCLEERFHPYDHASDLVVGAREDRLALQFLQEREVMSNCSKALN